MGITAEEQKGHIYYRCTKNRRLVALNLVREVLAPTYPKYSHTTQCPKTGRRGYCLADEDEKDSSKTTATLAYGLREQTAFKSKIDRITDLFVEQDIDQKPTRQGGLASEKIGRGDSSQVAKRGKSLASNQCEWIKDASTLDEIAKGDDLPPKILLQKYSART